MKRPAAGPKGKLRLKGGDNRLEASFGAVKRGLRRKNALQNSRHAGANFFAAAYLRHSPGLAGVGKAVRHWLSTVVGKADPYKAWVVSKADPFDEPAPALPKKARKPKATAKARRVRTRKA